MTNDYYHLLGEAKFDKAKLQTECRELQRKYEAKLEEINKVEMAIEYIRSKMGNSISEDISKDEKILNQQDEVRQVANNSNDVTFIEGTIEILQDEGGALHINKILYQLEERYGRKTNARNLSGNIGKDSQKRFVNLGGNTWDLSSRYALTGLKNAEENNNGVVAGTTTPLFSSDKGGNN
jgi:hypothetical protein